MGGDINLSDSERILTQHFYMVDILSLLIIFV